jgi:2-dehydro-3-deoxyphosphogluconate aldolase / (4S)-4-hydroxy-2-oxoglutarate aldolase
LRTDAGLESSRRLAALPGMHVGAGTVLVPDQVDEVAAAGARFVVSPGLAEPVVRRCRSVGLAALPGVATASDLMVAAELGLQEVKFFPAAQLGGPAAIRALAAPFRHMAFMPSGGVSAPAAPAACARSRRTARRCAAARDAHLRRIHRRDRLSRSAELTQRYA